MHDAGDPLTGPAPALVARFRADAERLTPEPIKRLGVAVSGGPDSLALLLLALAAFPGRIAAATVDHGLRAESATEAAVVASLCQELGVPHETLSGRPTDRQGGVQAAARELRYALLGDWAERQGCSHVATAHHADDQAETMLLRLGRGAGLPGMAGIRPARPLGEGAATLVRPLLGWRRSELAAIVDSVGLRAVDDPSNRAARFDRTRVRAWLAASDEDRTARFAAAASHLDDCEQALAWAADGAWRLRAMIGDAIEIDVEGLPREIRRRLARRAIEAVRSGHGLSGAWREDGLDRVLAALGEGRGVTLAGVQCDVKGGWRFRAAPPRRG